MGETERGDGDSVAVPVGEGVKVVGVRVMMLGEAMRDWLGVADGARLWVRVRVRVSRRERDTVMLKDRDGRLDGEGVSEYDVV